MKTLKPVTFIFDMLENEKFQGYALDTTWNGFDNVKVTLETALDMDFRVPWASDDYGCFSSIPIGDDGLIDLSNGWATVIID